MNRSIQCARTVLMVRPRTFAFNEQTCASNAFQTNDSSLQDLAQVLREFDMFVDKLKSKGVKVIVIVEDEGGPSLPDAIFPNNWFSTHYGSLSNSVHKESECQKETIDHLCLYPLAAQNRRLERSLLPVLPYLRSNYKILHEDDIELNDNYLEGTGSLVLDRINKRAYATESPRTSVILFKKWCNMFGYEPVVFKAADSNGVPIYHTNLMLSIGYRFVIFCKDVVQGDSSDILRKLSGEGYRAIIEISESQMRKCAGNVLEVSSQDNKSVIVISEQAWNSLNETQQSVLRECGEMVIPDIKSIETIGGGSCRCMMAEIFSRSLPSTDVGDIAVL